MNKLFSIIIPTYNMEEFLPRCLDSVVGTKYIDEVEILVVNDGSKDCSSQIAHSYEARFPQSVIVIDKENGNYGSTINAALPVATGKYVKLLDADDWFDPKAFDAFLDKIRGMEADLIITPYTRTYADGLYRKMINKVFNDEHKDYGISDLEGLDYIAMHAYTYRLSILKDNNYWQTGGISYTDNEWIFYPMEYVRKIKFVNANLYQYYLGREGQTMSMLHISSNHFKDHVVLYHRMIDYIASKDINREEMKYMLRFMLVSMKKHFYGSAEVSKNDQGVSDLVIQLEDHLATYPELYKLTDDIAVRYLCSYRFTVRQWRENNRRWGVFVKRFMTMRHKASQRRKLRKERCRSRKS